MTGKRFAFRITSTMWGKSTWMMTSSNGTTLKRKCRHFDEILITGCTGSCHFDNFQCSQWWKFHQNEDISVSVNFRVTGPLCEEFTSHRWIPSQRPVNGSFDIFFDLRQNTRLSKQSRRRWFKTLPRSLWRHCNVTAANSPHKRPVMRSFDAFSVFSPSTFHKGVRETSPIWSLQLTGRSPLEAKTAQLYQISCNH